MSESAWGRFRRDTEGRVGAALLLLVCAVALLSPLIASDAPLLLRDGAGLHCPAAAGYPVIGPLFRRRGRGGAVRWSVPAPVPFGADSIALSERLLPPSRRHWLGTDDLGRDLLARIIAASPVAAAVGLFASGLASLVGLLLGAAAGAAGGITDAAISRLIEVTLCFPAIVLILALVALFPPSLATVVAAIAIAGWPEAARLARAEVLKARELDSTRAAIVAGASRARILFTHFLPAALTPVLVAATFAAANAILLEAGLAFLGLGVPPPQPTWGGELAVAQEYLGSAWWLAVFPGAAIFATVASYNLVGEAWQRALSPGEAAVPEKYWRRPAPPEEAA